MYTAGGGSAGPTLSLADEKVSTGCGVRYADRHTEQEDEKKIEMGC